MVIAFLPSVVAAARGVAPVFAKGSAQVKPTALLVAGPTARRYGGTVVEVNVAGNRVNDGRRRARRWAAAALTLMLAASARVHAADDGAGRIESIQLKTDAGATKVIIMLSKPLAFDVRVLDGDAARKSARRLVLDFANTTLAPEAVKPIPVDDGFVRQVRTGQFTASTARIVLDLASNTTHSVDAYETPPHVTVAIAGSAPTETSPGTR
jgi:hypothetical protein